MSVLKRKLRFATWNIDSLTGRCRELADVLMRRWVQCKAGVALVLSEELRNGLLEVDHRCDRLLRVRVLIKGVITNLISTYTPQAGCSGSEKESFWEQFEEVLRAIPAAEFFEFMIELRVRRVLYCLRMSLGISARIGHFGCHQNADRGIQGQKESSACSILRSAEGL
nr:uncharacterized protein LOC116769111 [Danaus plexippus plexippus]